MPEEVLFADERRRTRAEIADYLRSVAEKLEAGEPVTFSAGGDGTSVAPPAQPTFEVKVERETARGGGEGELSIELEIEWYEGEAAEEGGSLAIE